MTRRATFLPFTQPAMGEEEIAAVVETMRSGWLTTGPNVERLEQDFRGYVKADDAQAVSSGTAALHLALLGLGIGPGDVVATTPLTFCSTVHVIEHVGARPLLIDVAPGTLNIDIERLADQVASGSDEGPIKAVLPVHLGGLPCDLDAIDDLARRYDLAVIEDAAHALPSRYKGRLVGQASEGDLPRAVCFSFYATKNVTTAEGGMLTGTPGLLDETRRWGLHGMNRDAWERYGTGGSWQYDVDRPGYKYNMSDLQAAIGIQQLAKLDGFHRKRAYIASRYNDAFAEIAEVQLPADDPSVEQSWHLYVLRLRLDRLVIDRDEFIEQMIAQNIGVSVHFIPVHLHTWTRNRYGFEPESFPNTYSEFLRLVSLPIYPGMTDDDIDDVILAVSETIKLHSRAI